MEINENCFKLSAGGCVHWYKEKYDYPWVAITGDEIINNILSTSKEYPKSILEEHKIQTKGCGNPYHNMTKDERIAFLKTKPEHISNPTGLGKSATVDISAILNFNEDIVKVMKGDAWGVYSMKSNTHVPVNVYYDLNMSGYQMSVNGKQHHLRQSLIKDPAPLVKELNDGNTVVVLMGGKIWKQYYYTLVNGSIIKVVVDLNECMIDTISGEVGVKYE